MRKTVDILGVGRDDNKVYRITEFGAFKAEKMAMRALWAIAGAGVEIPEDMSTAPLAKLIEIGLVSLSKIPFHIAEPLLAEMLEGVNVVLPDSTIRKLLPDDIEEYRTILKLRKEVIALHLDFFIESDPQTTV